MGTNPSFTTFITEMLQNKHRLFFISFKEPDPTFLSEELSRIEIKTIFRRDRNIDRLFKSFLFVILAPLLSVWLCLNQKIDVFYCDDSLPIYGFLIKKITRSRVVIRLGDWQIGYLLADRTSTLKNLLFKIISHIERVTWSSVDGVIVISNAFKNFLISQKVVKDRLFVVEECVDTHFNSQLSSEHTRQKYNIIDANLIMFHGILVPIKGLETLLNAVPLVLQRFPNTKFMIIGNGPSLPGLMNMAKKLSIENSVIFTGWVQFRDILKYLVTCDIGIAMRSGNIANNFVITTALLQYMSLGKPVVAPNLKTTSQVLTHGKTGMLFEPDNPLDLADKIMYLLQNPHISKEIGRNGMKLARERFDSKLVGENLAKTLTHMAKTYKLTLKAMKNA